MMNEQGRPRVKRVAVFVCVAAAVILFDQLTKWAAVSMLSDGRRVPVLGPILSLRLLYNPGASLGMGANMTWLISLFAVVACVVLFVLAIMTESMLWTVSFAMAFGGAFGNLFDRVAYANGFLNGKVIDFIDYGWSVGNVADIALMAAALMICGLVVCSTPFVTPAASASDASDRADASATGIDADAARDASFQGDASLHGVAGRGGVGSEASDRSGSDASGVAGDR